MYLGIDLGTSSVKLLMMDAEGHTAASVTEEYPVAYFNDNWAEQNASDWWDAVCRGMEKILSMTDSKQLKSISFSGQMHGLVMLDENDDVIRPVILWCDQRTQKECDWLNNDIGRDKLVKLCGNVALTGFTASKILWIKNNEPENFKRIRKIMLPKDYIAYRLTGVFSCDYSDASGTNLLDVKNRKWSSEMLEICGIRREQLPELFESYEKTGNVTKKIAEKFGISPEVIVAAGAGDQAAGAVGTGAVAEGNLSVALGTSGVIFAPDERFTLDSEYALHSFAHANGKWHQMGVILSAASSLKWWVESVNRASDFNEFTAEAEKVPAGSDKLFFLPYLIGERTPHNDPDAKGTFIGLKVSHSRAHLTRAVLEGVIFAMRDSLELLKNAGVKAEYAVISGGGAKSPLWNQITANILNVRVRTLKANEGPAFGAAILAAVADGLFDTVESACGALVKYQHEFVPAADEVKKYDSYYRVFCELYPALRDSYKKIASLE